MCVCDVCVCVCASVHRAGGWMYMENAYTSVELLSSACMYALQKLHTLNL